MNGCPSCGVEFADTEKKCPLCGTIVARTTADSREKPYPDHVFNAENNERITSAEVRKISGEIITVSCMIAFTVSLLADVFLNTGITWSRYTSICIGAGWVFLCMPLILHGKPWIAYAVIAPTLVLFLFLLDILDGKPEWFLLIGMPISVSGAGTWAAVMGLCMGFKEKGLNVIATLLSGITFWLLALEAMVSLFVYGGFRLNWSIVTSFATLPVAVFCYYLHYRITKKASLRKLFRL